MDREKELPRNVQKQVEESIDLRDRALAASRNGIIITDPNQPDNPIIYVNPSFERMTGYTAQEAIGHNSRFLQNEDRDQPILPEIKKAVEEGREFYGILRNYRKGGERFLNELSISPVRDYQGKLMNFIGVMTDITALFQTQQELSKTNQLLYSIIENIPDMVVLKDAKDLSFQLLNKAAESLIGQSRESLIGKNGFDILPPKQAKFALETDQETLRQKALQDIPAEPMETPSGGKRILHTKKVPILTQQDEAMYILEISEDITDTVKIKDELQEAYKNLEQKVQERTYELAQANRLLQTEIDERRRLETELKKALSRERLIRRIIEIVSQTFDIDAILQSTAVEVGTFFNADRCILSRYEEDEAGVLKIKVSGQYRSSEAFALVSEADVPIRSALDIIQCASKIDETVVINAYFPNEAAPQVQQYFEKYQIKSLLGIQILYRGTPFGFLSLHQCHQPHTWTLNEITLLKNISTHIGVAFYQTQLYEKEQIARAEAESANRRKDLFLASMSHELRTPLNAIIGFAQMLEEKMAGYLNEKQEKYAHNIVVSGRHLLDMVNNILDIAKIESGKTDLSIQPLQLIDLISDLEAIFQEIAAQRGVSIHHMLGPGIAEVRADPARFRQILFNLMNNAIKFNRPGGEVWVRFFKSPDNRWAIGEVSDTGIGIPKEEIPKLFNEFYRVEAALSYKQEGTGLGLAVTKKLIEHHGGSISVESEEGVGSTFKFNLPL